VGLQAQLKGSSCRTIPDNGNVLFNKVVNAPSAELSYNSADGNFTITQPGNYFVSWWVNTDGVKGMNTVSFGIRVVNGGSAVILASSPSPITTLQLNGSALLTVTTIPMVFNLFNNSGAAVNYGLSEIQANLVIIGISIT
jgi:hypothetical protein